MAGGAGDTLPPTGTSFARSRRVPARNRREQGRQGPGSLSGPRPPWGGERLRPKSDTLHRVFLGPPLLPGRKGGLTILEMEEESPRTATRDRPGQAWAWSGRRTPLAQGREAWGGKQGPRWPAAARAVCPRRPLPQKLPSAWLPQQDRAIYSQRLSHARPRPSEPQPGGHVTSLEVTGSCDRVRHSHRTRGASVGKGVCRGRHAERRVRDVICSFVHRDLNSTIPRRARRVLRAGREAAATAGPRRPPPRRRPAHPGVPRRRGRSADRAPSSST